MERREDILVQIVLASGDLVTVTGIEAGVQVRKERCEPGAQDLEVV
jgi:hypothetical protein